MDVSDTTKQMIEMIQFEAESDTMFFVLRKDDGTLSVLSKTL
jgi:hypothetical protein